MKTIINFFEESVKQFGDNIYMLEKREGQYHGTTYREIQELSQQFAAGLISMGINKEDRIGLIAEGCNNWIISELGIHYAGAVNVRQFEREWPWGHTSRWSPYVRWQFRRRLVGMRLAILGPLRLPLNGKQPVANSAGSG